MYARLQQPLKERPTLPQVPSYCLADSALCLFVLKKEFDCREELKALRASNLELEYKVGTKEIIRQFGIFFGTCVRMRVRVKGAREKNMNH